MIQRDEHVGFDHALHLIVGGHNHVIARIACFELREEFVAIGKQIKLHFNASGFVEVFQSMFANISIIIKETQFLVFFRKRKTWQESQPCHHASALDEAAAIWTCLGFNASHGYP